MPKPSPTDLGAPPTPLCKLSFALPGILPSLTCPVQYAIDNICKTVLDWIATSSCHMRACRSLQFSLYIPEEDVHCVSSRIAFILPYCRPLALIAATYFVLPSQKSSTSKSGNSAVLMYAGLSEAVHLPTSKLWCSRAGPSSVNSQQGSGRQPPRTLVIANVLRPWQIQRLEKASAQGRRNISIKELCGDLQLQRGDVLQWLKDHQPGTDQPTRCYSHCCL